MYICDGHNLVTVLLYLLNIYDLFDLQVFCVYSDLAFVKSDNDKRMSQVSN